MQRDSGGRLGEVLVSIGALSDQALAHALAAFFGFEVANLRRENIDPAVTSLPARRRRARVHRRSRCA